jgi:hypothetical protein
MSVKNVAFFVKILAGMPHTQVKTTKGFMKETFVMYD